MLLSSAGNPKRCTLTQPPRPSAASALQHRHRHQHQRRERRPQQHVEHRQHDRQDRRDRRPTGPATAASRASSAWASDPPTTAPGSTECTESRSASTVSKASAEAGLASSDHRPLGQAAVGCRPASADTTPGVSTIARCMSSARPVGADHAGRIGQPAGEVRGKGLVAGDRFGLAPGTARSATARSVCPAGRCQQPRARRSTTVATQSRTAAPPRRRSRCHVPLVGEGFRADVRNERPEQPLPEQRQQRRQHQQDEHRRHHQTRDAACTPRLRVLGDDANSRVSSASTTVALLATIAGPARRTAASSARHGALSVAAATPRGSARSAAAHSWCPPRTPARW